MQITLNGKNIDVTNALKDYVNEKFDRILKHNGQIMNLKVTLNVNKNPSVKNNNTAEVTCFLNGSVIKIKEDAETMYAAIDLLSDRLDRQVREIKEKLINKTKSTNESIRTSGAEEELIEETEEEEEEAVASNIE
ncbi:MAG TPA: ribosome-associated translation inhibitor RaiA [Candidatus Gastranaerophilales bacterium]|nr:ribosome-associated translation inhibitor RaiA [Candidatus Gastranaerophilales bacterium]